jgi:DNA-binding CsgD family transcriptional regulator
MEGVQTRNGLYGFEFRDIDLRRVPQEERKTYDIKGMWQRSHEIVNLAARGLKNVEIAEVLNIHEQTVSNTLNSDLGQKKLAELRGARDNEAKIVSEKIRVLTNKAIETYHEIFDNENGEATLKDRKEVADTVLLELSGLRAPTRLQTSNVNLILSKTEIEDFKNRGKKALQEMGEAIDMTEEPKNGSESLPATT